ncbi:unnamed protein product [Bodo saltans]|uniref:Uncharacterized protein n=1 Tax=Bodo saltans TaxID=75058 RepID=A0A0S4IT73_BODSA|nr:unnamed protein product [Bodo saltans]|eukprot:CUF80256.1 unnamed protein product [Bodo saltans]
MSRMPRSPNLLVKLPLSSVATSNKASAKEIQQDQPVRLETRYVQVPSLFELSGHPTDAAKSLCAMIRPSFVSIPSGARSIGGGSGYFGVAVFCVNGSECVFQHLSTRGGATHVVNSGHHTRHRASIFVLKKCAGLIFVQNDTCLLQNLSKLIDIDTICSTTMNVQYRVFSVVQRCRETIKKRVRFEKNYGTPNFF